METLSGNVQYAYPPTCVHTCTHTHTHTHTEFCRQVQAIHRPWKPTWSVHPGSRVVERAQNRQKSVGCNKKCDLSKLGRVRGKGVTQIK